MWCETCGYSYVAKTSISLTSDGREVVTKRCGICNQKTVIEFYSGPTISMKVHRANRPAKRHS
jgi:hypothetical protein